MNFIYKSILLLLFQLVSDFIVLLERNETVNKIISFKSKKRVYKDYP